MTQCALPASRIGLGVHNERARPLVVAAVAHGFAALGAMPAHAAALSVGRLRGLGAASWSARSIAVMLVKFMPTGFGLRSLSFHRLKVVG